MIIAESAANAPLAMQVTPADWPGGYWWHWLFFTVIIIAFVLVMVIGAIYIERRGMARMQLRLGPNRTGPFGLLQPVADAVKVLLKENIVILPLVFLRQQLRRPIKISVRESIWL